jgi:hypothetical protein
MARTRLTKLLLGGTLLLCGTDRGSAQLFKHACKPCCPPACSQPCTPAPAVTPEPAPKVETPPPDQPPIIEPSFAAEQAAAGGDYYAAAPNMIGDLAGSTIGLGFGYLNSLSPAQVELSNFGNLINAKIAENNSPLPMDRVAFRYNYFHNAGTVEGPADPVQIPQVGNFFAGTTSRAYDTQVFNFSLEKTFFQDLCSVELRVPLAHTLGSDLALSPGAVVPGDPLPVFAPNAADAFGDTDTEFGDIQVVLKGLFYYTSRVAVAGGLGIGAPTGSDSHVQVLDFVSVVNQDPSQGTTSAVIGSRTRDFQIDNEMWTLSPYFAALVRPTDRLFMQGFYQLYFPLGGSQVTYTNDVDLFLIGQRFQDHAEGEIDGQTLMMADLGIGYWLVRNPSGFLTGLAPILELHYTTALEDADVLILPGDGLAGPTGQAQPASQVGNLDNRFDYLNLTVGATAEINQRLLVTTGVAVPLRDDNDRFFDWEFQLQINYRFGPAPEYLLPPL